MTRISILAYDGIEPIDIGATFGVLSMAKRVVSTLTFNVVAPGGGAIEMANGLVLMAQCGLGDDPAPDVLMVLGGPGWEAASRDQRILAHIRKVDPSRTVLASVCTGGMILAAAGVLDGRDATTKRAILPGEAQPLGLMADRYPDIRVREARIVDTGSIVTGGGVSLGIDMTLYLLARLCGDEAARETARILEYDRAWQANAVGLDDLQLPA